ncbi:LysR family transcriptional regulator [Comamonadaceae bacterium G21597-S1]|nr:LysR family transcriptional regulator [Comamonadaceae bacterium G21597-S1]
MARLPPLNWLRAFEASARALSFTEAAQELHMTQSAVSQQIKSLESALGRQLFHRRARGLELTDIGRGYLPTVQAAFNTLEEGTAVLTGRNEPDVLELHSNISFATFWLTPRLHLFLAEFPWVQLDVATSIWPAEKPRNLAAVEIVLGLGKWEGRAGQRLTRDTIFPVCTPELARDIGDVNALLRHRLFELPGTLQTWDNWLAGAIGHRKFERPRTHLVSTWALSMQWALQGLGVALAHDTVANDLIAQGRLVRLLDHALPMKEAYYLISPEGSLINPAAKAFKGWLMQQLKS